MKNKKNETQHVPVMTKEIVENINPQSGGIYVDCTLGGAGHITAMMQEVIAKGLKGKTVFIGIDQDQDAIDRAQEKLKTITEKEKNIELHLVHENFENLSSVLRDLKIENGQVDGIWADLGTSEDQLIDESRGFSFLSESELDMRMDKSMPVRAADLVNGLTYKELVELFTNLADLGSVARFLARAIVDKRNYNPILTTKQLVEIIRQAVPNRSIGSHTFIRQKQAKLEARVFQALRIAVNHELDSLKRFLPQALEALKAQGRLVVISFHSGEDRIVKHFFIDSVREEKAEFIQKLLTPTVEEIQRNQKSSSAKLRAVAQL